MASNGSIPPEVSQHTHSRMRTYVRAPEKFGLRKSATHLTKSARQILPVCFVQIFYTRHFFPCLTRGDRASVFLDPSLQVVVVVVVVVVAVITKVTCLRINRGDWVTCLWAPVYMHMITILYVHISVLVKLRLVP
jgi:hypothetical protein